MNIIIDINEWSRKNIYSIFSKFDDPYTGLVTNIDVTEVINFCKENKVSFYGVMSYLTLKSFMEIDAFKYGYTEDEKDKRVCKYDNFAISNTVIDKTGELTFTRYVEYDENIQFFLNNFNISKERAIKCEDLNDEPYLAEVNKVYATCLPWIQFSCYKDALDLKNAESKPKVCWGQYYEENGSYKINYSLLVNHAFQDGIHICNFFNNLQNNIRKLGDKEKFKILRV